ncbi:MAG: hypothetical protein V1722_04545, partial [Candidatus Micrarchaeota archaeon]
MVTIQSPANSLAKRLHEFLATEEGKSLMKEHGLRRSRGLITRAVERVGADMTNAATKRGSPKLTDYRTHISFHKRGLKGAFVLSGTIHIGKNAVSSIGPKIEPFTTALADRLNVRRVEYRD